MAIGATTTRTRTRPAAGATGGNAAQSTSPGWMKRGDEARQRADAEIARQQIGRAHV